MEPVSTSPEWESAIKEIVSSPGVAMVIGGVDTGKTNFCTQLSNAAVDAGIPTAVVDADIGQSEIGAPGTIGMALADRKVEAMSDLKARRLYFIGATSPVRHLIECVVGTKKMVDAAIEAGARLVVVDTTGLVDGPIGRKLKTYKIDLVRPQYLVGIQKKHEIESLLAPFAKVEPVKILKISSSQLARRKPTEFRIARRQLSFYNHFHNCPGHIIHLDSICTWNTWFGTGRPMKWQYQKFMEETLRCRILHAEVTGRGIFAISERSCSSEGVRLLEEYFKTTSITIMRGETFTNLLVGLADETGRTLDVGLLQAIDFDQRFMFVLSPIKTISPVRVVQFGSIRVSPEGKELGTLPDF
ncbi:MAG: Clp1/GlmU family protein [Armatimonadetes bacterium]|nr:Clp1/GlmU family protein [Armatimonadota bacterium]